MAGVELVEDKATKKPFPAEAKVSARMGQELFQRGLYTRMRGDTICLAPPLVTAPEQIDRIVDIVRDAIDAVVGT